MRPWVAALSALVLCTLVPSSSGQEASGGSAIAEDKSGDVVLGGPSLPDQGAPAQHFQALDLTALSVAEADAGFAFTLSVAGLDQAPEAPGLDDSVYFITFAHNDQAYRIVMLRALGDQSYYWGYLLKYDPDGNLNYQSFLDVVADAAAGSMSVTVLREDLLDRKGAAPFPGRRLEAFAAESHLRTNQDDFARVNGQEPSKEWDATDRMPDSGNATKALTVQKGLAQSGHAALWSADPVRASNGEQATFVFNVTGQNAGSSEDVFVLTATGVPEGWKVSMPAATVRLGAGETVPLPVLVSTPFSHTHGLLKGFRLEMTSQSDPGSVGRIDLGIRYFAVPQPAGHHDTVFVHSGTFGSENPLFQAFELGFSGNSGFTYMNTLENDPDDAKKPIDAYYQGWGCFETCAPPESKWLWHIGLQPALQLGMDWDLAGKLDVQLPIQTRVPMPGLEVSGYMVHQAYDEGQGQWRATVVASLPPTAPMDLQPGVQQIVSWTVSPAPASDYLPYAKRAYLSLVVNATTLRPSSFTGVEAPQLVPGGVIRMPLFEYHDAVSESLRSVGAVRLDALGDRERLVNPGKAAVFAARLVNDLDHEVAFVLDVSGVNADWAQILGQSDVSVPARSAVEVRLGVRVPAGAADRDVADVVLEAQDPSNPAIRTLVRLRATVDTQATQPDDSAQLEAYAAAPAQQSPGAAAAVLLGLGLAAWMTRRGPPPS